MLDVTYHAEALNDTINLTNLYYFIFAWFNIRIIICCKKDITDCKYTNDMCQKDSFNLTMPR